MARLGNIIGVMHNVDAARAEAIAATLRHRGRGYASDAESWAELKVMIEHIKKVQTEVEKLHKEMWDEVKSEDRDAYSLLIRELQRRANEASCDMAMMAAVAEIAEKELEPEDA